MQAGCYNDNLSKKNIHCGKSIDMNKIIEIHKKKEEMILEEFLSHLPKKNIF